MLSNKGALETVNNETVWPKKIKLVIFIMAKHTLEIQVFNNIYGSFNQKALTWQKGLNNII